MKLSFLLTLASLVFLFGCKNDEGKYIIASGQMPTVAAGKSESLHLVYGNGDSILYSYSSDDGKTFSAPVLISVLPKLAASHMRGPQIASTTNGVVVTACNQLGDIFSFVKDQSGKWVETGRVNDIDTVAKENLMVIIHLLYGLIFVINIIKSSALSQMMAERHGRRIC